MTEPQLPLDPAAIGDDLVPPVFPGAGPPPRPPITVPVGGDTFRIDVDRAPQAIRDLEDALDQLRQIRTDAAKMRQVTPPTADPISRDVALVLGAAAEGGPGSLVPALDAGIEQIRTLISGLHAGLQHYAHTDHASAGDLSSAP